MKKEKSDSNNIDGAAATHQQREEEQNLIAKEEQTKEIIDFQYNRKTKESYERLGFAVPPQVEQEERNFLSLVNIEEGGPIRREITRLVRIRARDYTSGDKMLYREYLYWTENWYAKDWLGQDIPPVADHLVGVFYQQEYRTVVDRDMRSGRVLPPMKKRTGQHEEYYLPWEGKEQVDRILGDRDRDSVIYTIKFPAGVSGGTGIRSNFSYNHFVNLSMEEAFKLNSKAGGSSMNPLTAANAIRSESGIT